MTAVSPDGLGAPPDLEALRALASAVAREAGATLLRLREVARTDVATKSSATDMVSDADRASERLIVERILTTRPGDAFLGEEGGERASTDGARVRWVVDPLDGTTNYLYGVPFFAVSIAAEVDGEVAVGVVYDPSRDELFEAVRGRGATCNGRPIAPTAKADLATALVDTGFDYNAERRAVQGRVLAHVISRVRDLRRHGAASLDLVWVACGRADGYHERGLGGAWDIAAGDLIVREAGGRTASLDGGAANPASMVATGPLLLEPLLALLHEAERAAR
jgi:myo-inositol-1(or 4)-monophosphatase